MLKLLTKINKTLELLVVANLAIMTIIVFINVVLRYGFNSGITMTEELSRVLFVWLTFMGAILALDHNEHVSVDFVVKKLPTSLLHIWSILSDGILLALNMILFIGCYKLSTQNMSNHMPITGIPTGINYMAACVMSVMFTLTLSARMMIKISTFGKGA